MIYSWQRDFTLLHLKCHFKCLINTYSRRDLMMQRGWSIFTEIQFLLRKAHFITTTTENLHNREKLGPCVLNMNHLTLKYPQETQGLRESEDLIKITVKVLSWAQPAAGNRVESSGCCTDSSIKIHPSQIWSQRTWSARLERFLTVSQYHRL